MSKNKKYFLCCTPVHFDYGSEFNRIFFFFIFYFVLRVAEALLPGSRFHRYVRDGRSIVRSSSSYSVHDEVHQHLDFGEILLVSKLQCFQVRIGSDILFCSSVVGGLHRVPPKGKDANRKRPRSKAGVHLGVTPAVLRTRYNLTATDVGSAENNSQAVAQVGSRLSLSHFPSIFTLFFLFFSSLVETETQSTAFSHNKSIYKRTLEEQKDQQMFHVVSSDVFLFFF